jgi:hypothetical protein
MFDYTDLLEHNKQETQDKLSNEATRLISEIVNIDCLPDDYLIAAYGGAYLNVSLRAIAAIATAKESGEEVDEETIKAAFTDYMQAVGYLGIYYSQKLEVDPQEITSY